MQPLNKLLRGETLSKAEVGLMLSQLFSFSSPQQGAIFALLAARGETVEELEGALAYLLAQSCPLPFEEDIVEIVGTGGDNLKTFNISTAASLVLAAAKVKVAKHGGRAVSSLSGSTDVIQALNIPVYEDPTAIYHTLQKNHFAFLFAPLFNPVLKDFASLRKSLNVPTLFNILPPLLNPLRPKRQVIGVFREDLIKKVAEILLQQGVTHAMVVRSFEGLDEISVSGPTTIAEIKNQKINIYTLSPEEVGLSLAPLSEVEGGNAEQNAQIIQNIFANKQKGAKLDIVLLNAAAGFIVSGRVDNFQEGIVLARETIEAQKAFHLLQTLKGDKI